LDPGGGTHSLVVEGVGEPTQTTGQGTVALCILCGPHLNAVFAEKFSLAKPPSANKARFFLSKREKEHQRGVKEAESKIILKVYVVHIVEHRFVLCIIIIIICVSLIMAPVRQ
jgi:hypothetical protein